VRNFFVNGYDLTCAVLQTAGDRQLAFIAAGVSFFGVFSIFPGIAAVIAIFGLVADPTVVADQFQYFEDLIPEPIYNMIWDQISRLLGASSETLGWATFVSTTLAIWSARAGVSGLVRGLNAIADEPPRNGVFQAVFALGLTVILMAMALVAIGLFVFAPIILTFFPWTGDGALRLEIMRWVIGLSVLFAALSLLYRFGPNQKDARIRWVTAGAGFVIVMFVAASSGLTYYLANFGRYNEIYGSIGAVIALLLWVYMASFLVLLGAALNVHVYGGVTGRSAD